MRSWWAEGMIDEAAIVHEAREPLSWQVILLASPLCSVA
jgi:hypothetical protein